MPRIKGIAFAQVVCRSTLAILATSVLLSCSQVPGITYSVEDQFALSRARAVELTDQLQFSFKLDSENVAAGQDIFFTATFTNTTDHSIAFREPKQYGVFEIEFYDTTLLFSMKPISEDILIEYPLEVGFVYMLSRQVLLEDFVALPPHSSREIRLELPHMVKVNDSSETVWPAEFSSLPVAQYQVQMTYMNDAIGYEVELLNDFGYVDLNAWVGSIASDPVLLTITP